MAGRKQKSSCFGTAIAILFGFAVLYGCASSCTSSKSPKPQSPPTSIPAEDQILKTMVAEIQLSYTPTIPLLLTPSLAPTDEPPAEIALIPTLPTIRETSSPTPARQKYIVQDGDTCWGIAVDKYKIPLESFLVANGISAAYCDISVGQEVVIPAADNPVPTALPYAAPTSVPVYIAPTAAPVYAAPAVVAPASDYAAPDNCHPNYIGACIPMDRGDIDCGDIPDKGFQWVNYDPYKLDRDKNGICCEN